MIANLSAIFPLLLSVISTTCLLIGSCRLFISFIKDITNDLEFFNSSGMSTNRNYIKMKERFCKIIKNYVEVKQLSQLILIINFDPKENGLISFLDLSKSSIRFLSSNSLLTLLRNCFYCVVI